MGCGGSTEQPDGAATKAKYDDGDGGGGVTREAHDPDPYDDEVHPEAARLLVQLAEFDADLESVAETCDEPTPMALDLRVSFNNFKARLLHGIDGDAKQFKPFPEPELSRKHYNRVALWADYMLTEAEVDTSAGGFSVTSGGTASSGAKSSGELPAAAAAGHGQSEPSAAPDSGTPATQPAAFLLPNVPNDAPLSDDSGTEPSPTSAGDAPPPPPPGTAPNSSESGAGLERPGLHDDVHARRRQEQQQQPRAEARRRRRDEAHEQDGGAEAVADGPALRVARPRREALPLRAHRAAAAGLARVEQGAR
jgi:hypothetical protein